MALKTKSATGYNTNLGVVLFISEKGWKKHLLLAERLRQVGVDRADLPEQPKVGSPGFLEATMEWLSEYTQSFVADTMEIWEDRFGEGRDLMEHPDLGRLQSEFFFFLGEKKARDYTLEGQSRRLEPRMGCARFAHSITWRAPHQWRPSGNPFGLLFEMPEGYRTLVLPKKEQAFFESLPPEGKEYLFSAVGNY